MYEGTGKKGRSFLRKVDFKTGKSIAQINLDDSIFGEGITIFNNKIYQLTWQGGIGIVYDLETFEKEKEFKQKNRAEIKLPELLLVFNPLVLRLSKL